MNRRILLVVLAVVAVGGGVIAWLILSKPALPPGFASGNGRLEATQLYVAAKTEGRIKDVLFNEGDTVEAGQVVGHMDTDALEAQLSQALAKIEQAKARIEAAQADKNYALAQVSAKEADANFSSKQYSRSKVLVPRGAVSEQEAEVDFARVGVTKAEVVGAQAKVTQSTSAIDAAKADADAAAAEAQRLRVEIKDAVLTAPIRARVQARLAEPGEVLASGGRLLSLVDLSDVYMYVFLPEKVTGKVALGSEARIVLDAAPEYPIRAFVSYVSPTAQFTPKTVETAEERHNLTFRVKLQIDKNRLRQFEPLVKLGIPGMGYVRFGEAGAWPAKFEVKPVSPETLKLWNATGSSGPG